MSELPERVQVDVLAEQVEAVPEGGAGVPLGEPMQRLRRADSAPKTGLRQVPRETPEGVQPAVQSEAAKCGSRGYES